MSLLNKGMGPELHWFPADVPVARLAAVLTGMANTRGGTVLVGIAPRSAQVTGIPDAAATQDNVFQAALLIDPLLVLPLPDLVDVPVKTGSENAPILKVMRVTVPSGLPNVYSLEGRYLWREGVQTNPLPARRLRQLLVERGVLQIESQTPPDVSYDNLDPEKVTAYLDVLNPAGGETTEQLLMRRGCIRQVQVVHEVGVRNSEPANNTVKPAGLHCQSPSVYRPTYAGLLLFGRSPQRWMPSATILAARFFGATVGDRFIKQEIEGALPDQIVRAEAFIRDQLRRVVRIVGLTHEEVLEYPLEALRELLINAVVHRDYNLQGDPIHIHLFTDRIEFHSPGRLPGPMTLDNLLEARFSRNPILMQVLSDLGYVERLGYGLNRVIEVMRHYHAPPPKFEEVAGTFRVTLTSLVNILPQPGASAENGVSQVSEMISASRLPTPSELATYREMGLNQRQELALGFLIERRRITNHDMQELCPEVHVETLRRDLSAMVSLGLLIKVGDKRATYYILKR